MIELIQFPWSPFCLVQRRILEYSGVPFKIINIPNTDRSLVWRLTRQRYYGVPIIKDGRTVVFETDNDSQVIAKYLDAKLKLDLFPMHYAGLDEILWRHIEDQIEDPCFRLNDIYWQEMTPKAQQVAFLRHKERKFGRGCIDQWRAQKPQLLEQLAHRLMPFEQMLAAPGVRPSPVAEASPAPAASKLTNTSRPLHASATGDGRTPKTTSPHPFLLGSEPHFVDFALWGMLANFLYSGHYQLPKDHVCLNDWYTRMSKIKRPR